MLLDRDERCAAKLADFGFSLHREDPDKSFVLSVSAGTMVYMAPEALKGRVSSKADVYSFGVVSKIALIWLLFHYVFYSYCLKFFLGV